MTPSGRRGSAKVASERRGGYSSGKHHNFSYCLQESDTHMKPAEGSTVIGRSVTIRGELSGKEDLYMDGVVEGTIALQEGRLTVGPNARVLADIEARDVVVYGVVEGNVHATGRIELRESAALKGDIVAGRLLIEESASMKGRVHLQDRAGAEVRTAGRENSGTTTPSVAASTGA
jgi:cytoskeletal protein CcmA (bactofilin family)